MGREFLVKSPATPEKVAEIEQFLNARLELVAKSVAVEDTMAALSLTLLDLAGDFLLLQDELSRKDKESSERLSGLISKVDGKLL
jgi:hypothetical protein